MKYSVKALLWKHNPNPQGFFPVYIRITIAGKTRYNSTGYYIAEKYWDAKGEVIRDSHNMAALYNADIVDQKQKVVTGLVHKKLAGESISSGQAKRSMKAASGLNYFTFVDSYSADLNRKREGGTIENYRKHTLKLEQYHGSRSLTFADITADYLTKFESSLAGEGLSTNYMHMIIRCIRTMFNAAMKRGLVKDYPFKTYELPDYESPIKDYLSIAELDEVEKLADATTDQVMRQTATYFLLGAYTGLRISDWYKFSADNHVKAGMITLRATKNGEWVSVPITSRMQRALERIRTTPLMIEEPTINRTLKEMAKAIGSKKHLTTHSGRHTFAITMCADTGVSLETCATMMGITVKVCFENYYRVTPGKIKSETLAAWKGL